MTTSINFRVRIENIHPWEYVFVVGSVSKLGNWDPDKALELSSNEKSDIWSNHIELEECDTKNPLRFRYFIGYYLQRNTDQATKVRIISKWESQFLPRHLLCHMGSNNGIDVFGFYNGKTRISNGWLHQSHQNEILIRLHGPAFKFFKERYNHRPYFVKVISFDLRHKEVF
jgi:hypothetical protein